MGNAKDKLIVALDVTSFQEAIDLVENLDDAVDIYKVGSQLFTACGPVIIRHLIALNKKVFLDLKYHDIPNTVANAVRSAVHLNVLDHKVSSKNPEKGHLLMLTVHTIGGEEMLKRAVEAATKEAQAIGVIKPLVVGITVLTSDAKTDNIQNLVLQRAQLAKQAGCDGVVSSSQEVSTIREEFGDDFICVTPGIRPANADVGDQKRVATPKEAIENGSSFLVVGRPIVKALNPKEAALNILEEINDL
jgi:orotidine-5'-phosphate decarboxylase